MAVDCAPGYHHKPRLTNHGDDLDAGIQKAYESSGKHRLTQRAPDWWESPRFQTGFWLRIGSAKVATSRPSHQRVTFAVEPFLDG